ncbi:MAG: cytochrome P450 [Actinomycetota bacterium]
MMADELGSAFDQIDIVDVNDPGALSFVNIAPQNFGEIVAASKKLAAETGWVVATPAGPLVLGFKQVKSILRDPDWISVLSGVSMLEEMDSLSTDFNEFISRSQLSVPEAPSSFKIRPNVLSVEGEDHRRLRKLVNGSFSMGGARDLRPFMKSHAQSLISVMCDRGSGELVSEFCRPYPVPIICRLLGVDDADWRLFDNWADIIFSALDADTEAVIDRLDDVVKAQSELDAYVFELIEKRSKEPTGDLLSELIRGQEEEDRLTSDELVAMVQAILLAGTDTTRNQLGAMIAVLADHPDQYEALREDPSLIPAAVEESLRYISAVRTTARLAARDIVVDGIRFPAGTTVLLGLHAAGLSESIEDDGYEFNIARTKGCPHLAFGAGAHHCLGASLARAELQEALTAFVELVPTFRLTSPVIWKPLSMGIWGPAELNIAIEKNVEKSDEPGNNSSFKAVDISTNEVFGDVSTNPEDEWIRAASAIRDSVRSSIPQLIRSPKFPPLGRLVTTAFRFGKAVLLWKVRDRKLNDLDSRASLYRRLIRAGEKQGPAYVKLAQLISAAEGVFPEALVEECRKCRDQVSPEPWLKAKKILVKDLGPLKNNFLDVKSVPIAAASIAQVHLAELLDGTPVVIKIQRSKIRRRVTSDLRVMAWIAPRLVGKLPVAALANPPALVELFAETICEELDFRLEVANLFETGRALKSNARNSWELPDPYLELVSDRVIVMSRVSGVPLGDLSSLSIEPVDVRRIFRQMVDGLLEGAVIHGIFHGDFHAGNVFLGSKGEVGLVDFGITGRLDGERRIAFLRYVVGLMTGDLEAQVSGIRDLGAFSSDTDIGLLISEFQLDRDDFDPLELTEEEFVAEFRNLVRGLLSHGARIPKELMLFVKNFAYLSSVVQELDPDMDLLAEFSQIAMGFFGRNGVRVATEIGFSVDAKDISDVSLRRAVGMRDEVKTLTWREMQDRRVSMMERLTPQNVSAASDDEQNNSGQ